MQDDKQLNGLRNPQAIISKRQPVMRTGMAVSAVMRHGGKWKRAIRPSSAMRHGIKGGGGMSREGQRESEEREAK